jgi:hypothetical protein
VIEIVRASPAHIGRVANSLREMDRLECEAARMTPKDNLRYGIQWGETYTVKIDGKPEAMFGVVPTCVLTGRSKVWLLMSDKAARQRKVLVRAGVVYSSIFRSKYRVLENYVHAENDLAIRWLTRIGFRVDLVNLFVINGQPMRYFSCATPPSSLLLLPS